MSDNETEGPGPRTGSDAGGGFLDGRLLIAMPGLGDPRFHRTLVYLCAHSPEGAMGLIVNRPANGVTLGDLFERLSIPLPESMAGESVRFGGPVEPGRGFVLHTSDYHSPDATMRVDKAVSMTATLEVLHALAAGAGPERSIVALGYAGWAPGQLEEEIRQNAWLACEADPELLFGAAQPPKWEKALGKLGISAALLSSGGRA